MGAESEDAGAEDAGAEDAGAEDAGAEGASDFGPPPSHHGHQLAAGIPTDSSTTIEAVIRAVLSSERKMVPGVAGRGQKAQNH